ncbi:MAG: D-2-hydroxyacid dehydrogenase [Firmicutes bacterium]|nr:D-2-hydroxyacid dehydrogenase [Bacillota bacterium]
MYQILVVIPVDDSQRAGLMAAAPDAEFRFCSRGELTAQLVRGADVILGNVPPEMIRGSEKLKWLQLNSAGTNGYTDGGVLPEKVILTNASGAYGLAISEHMLGALLCIMKKLPLYIRDQDKQSWADHGPVTSIDGSRTLVVGVGDIGGEFARRMAALGSSVTGIRRHKTEKPDYLEGLYQMDRLTDCLREADIVASCLPGTKDTDHVFTAETFAAMKRGAYFLNIGRGTSVDSLALAEALNSGHLAGASVDVTDPEPLPPGHPLWTAKNLLITPHVSGGYHLQQTQQRIVEIARRNLIRFVRGEELENRVDMSLGYRTVSCEKS